MNKYGVFEDFFLNYVHPVYNDLTFRIVYILLQFNRM